MSLSLPACLPPACNRTYGNVHFMVNEETSTICTVVCMSFSPSTFRTYLLIHIMFQDVTSLPDFINISSRSVISGLFQTQPAINQQTACTYICGSPSYNILPLANHEFMQTGMWPWGKKKSLSSRPSTKKSSTFQSFKENGCAS